MPPATTFSRLETREQLWADDGTDSDLRIKDRVEKILEQRGELPLVVIGLVDLEADAIREIQENSPIREEMLVAQGAEQ